MKMKPLQNGVALSVTVAVFYSLCTLVEVLWPAQFLGFMNALFHGMNFRLLQASELHPWRQFVYALAVMMLWSFAIGACYTLVHDALAHVHFHRLVHHA
ncbi:hypothetical protein GCM10027321_31970 [Massilia terrae]|uniref:DUF5676 family membrane protein n=1 Tax=Massilia terrae TaxID=1811224 RepID=A0ABT2CS24_9BURK|nr:DUF5676 family membrane protein [Massilia terrae]MCS0656767.1 DUF5676 family membrane protein [Massilia terrae]